MVDDQRRNVEKIVRWKNQLAYIDIGINIIICIMSNNQSCNLVPHSLLVTLMLTTIECYTQNQRAQDIDTDALLTCFGSSGGNRNYRTWPLIGCDKII